MQDLREEYEGKEMKKTDQEHTDARWTPQRSEDGIKYCSTGCGLGCSYSDFAKAMRKAKSLCKRLGKDFKPMVSENLGWHWRVTKGNVTVVPFGLNEVYQAHYAHQFWVSASTPEGALTALLYEVKEEEKRMRKISLQVARALGEKK
jgi:hypothetical protein